MYKLIFGISLLLSLMRSFSGHAQTLFAGANMSTIRSDYVLGTVEMRAGYQYGINYVFNEDTPAVWNPFIQLEIARKGYRQVLDHQVYDVNFSYFTPTLGVVYQPIERLSFHLGADFSLLFKARQHTVSDTFRLLKNYRSLDLSVRTVLVCKLSRRMYAYSSFVYGLLALVVAPLWDDYGNYIKQVRDVRNASLQIGLQFALNPRSYSNDEKH